MPNINIGAGSLVLVKYPQNVIWNDIYILTENGHLIQVTDGINQNPQYDNFDADWSPNGDHIIFSTLKDDPTNKENTEIYTLEVSNPNNWQRLTNSSYLDEAPHWSGVNDKIVFVSNRHNNGKVQIYVMDDDGSNVTRLTNNGHEDMYPRWKQDASQIAFERQVTRPDVKIMVMDANGSNETDLTNVAGIHQSPAWSPDGSKIVFSSDKHNPRSGHFEIYIMDSVDNDGDGIGDNLARLTNMSLGNQNTAPSFYPDGSKIVFVNNNGTNQELYTIEPNGNNLTQITSDATSTFVGARVLP